jgi:hypothetical protein
MLWRVLIHMHIEVRFPEANPNPKQNLIGSKSYPGLRISAAVNF